MNVTVDKDLLIRIREHLMKIECKDEVSTIIEKLNVIIDVPKGKTIEQWLKKGLTPEEFENVKKNKVFRDNKNMKVSSLKDAIIIGFNWARMPEGYKYWENKYDNLKDSEL